jgi:glycosyltransferase involved in cell wall biosynthesis
MTDWDFVPNVLSREFCREAPGPRPPDDPFIFLSVGHMNRRKNHVGLVRAFALAFRDAPSVRLVLIGDGPEAGAVRRTAQVLGIAPRVALSGALAVGEVRAAMAQAHALVLASTAETFGVVLIEGLACGLPAIATDSGGPAAIITAQNGLLVDGGSDRKLADAMLKLKENFKAYDPSGIRAAALEAYGPERIGRQILAIAQRARAARSPRN